MPTSEIKAYYKHGDHAGESYLRDRFARPGGRAVSELELEPFRRWINLEPGQRLLDVGSGTGRILSTLSAGCRSQVSVVDSSPQMLEYLRAKFPEVSTYESDVFTFEPTERFHVITALRVFDHFSLSDQHTLLDRFKSFLQPDGRILIGVLVGPTFESISNWCTRYRTLTFFYTRRTYMHLFEQSGLVATRYNSMFVLPRGIYYRLPRLLTRPIMAADRLMSRLVPWACSSMICELRIDSSTRKD